MAMALEAGQNFLSGKKQRLPFTAAQATLATPAAALSGRRGTWEGHGAGAARLFLSAALKASPAGALDTGDPS